MRLSLFILGVFVAVACAEGPAEAQNYPWCAYYNFQHGGATNCGWVTFEQCLATVRGIGGSCGPNPIYQPDSARCSNTIVESGQRLAPFSRHKQQDNAGNARGASAEHPICTDDQRSRHVDAERL